MEAFRIKFTLPDGSITIRDLAFSQTIEMIGGLPKEDQDRFWGRPFRADRPNFKGQEAIEKEEVQLPLSNDRQRPWAGCKAWFIKEV